MRAILGHWCRAYLCSGQASKQVTVNGCEPESCFSGHAMTSDEHTHGVTVQPSNPQLITAQGLTQTPPVVLILTCSGISLWTKFRWNCCGSWSRRGALCCWQTSITRGDRFRGNTDFYIPPTYARPRAVRRSRASVSVFARSPARRAESIAIYSQINTYGCLNIRESRPRPDH